MTSLPKKQLDDHTLDILDPQWKSQYEMRKYEQINNASRMFNKMKLFYLPVLCFQLMETKVSILRPICFIVSCLFNHIAANLLEMYPQLRSYHAGVQMISQILFVFIDPNLYLKPSRHIALLVSFVANNFLVAIFISLSYKEYAKVIVVTTAVTIWYTVDGLEYPLLDIAPILALISMTCIVAAYQIELKDKNEFLDMK